MSDGRRPIVDVMLIMLPITWPTAFHSTKIVGFQKIKSLSGVDGEAAGSTNRFYELRVLGVNGRWYVVQHESRGCESCIAENAVTIRLSHH